MAFLERMGNWIWNPWLLGAFLLEKGRRRRGIAWFSLWSTLGFAAYYIFIGFTYVYVFSEAAEMTDYNRYIYPYYTGWLLAALAIFAAALRRAKPGALMHWALLALTAVCAWRVATFVPAELTVLNDLTGALSERTKNTESVERAKAFVAGAIGAGLDLGEGSGPLNHMYALDGCGSR